MGWILRKASESCSNRRRYSDEFYMYRAHERGGILLIVSLASKLDLPVITTHIHTQVSTSSIPTISIYPNYSVSRPPTPPPHSLPPTFSLTIHLHYPNHPHHHPSSSIPLHPLPPTPGYLAFISQPSNIYPSHPLFQEKHTHVHVPPYSRTQSFPRSNGRQRKAAHSKTFDIPRVLSARALRSKNTALQQPILETERVNAQSNVRSINSRFIPPIRSGQMIAPKRKTNSKQYRYSRSKTVQFMYVQFVYGLCAHVFVKKGGRRKKGRRGRRRKYPYSSITPGRKT